MPINDTSSLALTTDDIDKIRQLSKEQRYEKNTVIFSEGDNADYIYFISSGSVSIFIQKFTRQEEICNLVAGEYFGEMAFFSGDKRSASAKALTDTVLLRVDKVAFSRLLNNDAQISNKIRNIVARRNDELMLKENLGKGLCMKSNNLHISIKGDPSIRESAFTRERYASVVDDILPILQPCLHELLLNRCVVELVVHFNSGEIHARSIYNPLVDDIHPASKLINKAYIDRHFPPMDYQRKISLIRNMYAYIVDNADTHKLSPVFQEALHSRQTRWEPMHPSTIPDVVSKLVKLRKMQNFYLRNITIGIVEDTVRMQFNCDGAHILSSSKYQDFLNLNVPIEEDDNLDIAERRNTIRRLGIDSMPEDPYMNRRNPPGRREEDWNLLISALRQ